MKPYFMVDVYGPVYGILYGTVFLETINGKIL